MSRASNEKPPSPAGFPIVAGGLALAAFTIAIAWWSMRPPIELSDHSYDVTLALYRVCNQRSDEGLAKIESELAAKVADGQTPSAAEKAIQAILDQAKSGHWEDATDDCRRLMDDQVRR